MFIYGWVAWFGGSEVFSFWGTWRDSLNHKVNLMLSLGCPCCWLRIVVSGVMIIEIDCLCGGVGSQMNGILKKQHPLNFKQTTTEPFLFFETTEKLIN